MTQRPFGNLDPAQMSELANQFNSLGLRLIVGMLADPTSKEIEDDLKDFSVLCQKVMSATDETQRPPEPLSNIELFDLAECDRRLKCGLIELRDVRCIDAKMLRQIGTVSGQV